MSLPDPEELKDDLTGLEYSEGDNDPKDFAKLQLKSTSSKQPWRPRTYAAGYKPQYDNDGSPTGYGIMTVVFRDAKDSGSGFWYNYYQVPPEEWKGFKDAFSKGDYLRENGLDDGKYEGGPVDQSEMSKHQVAALKGIVRAARSSQAATWGQQSEISLRGKEVVIPNWVIDDPDKMAEMDRIFDRLYGERK